MLRLMKNIKLLNKIIVLGIMAMLVPGCCKIPLARNDSVLCDVKSELAKGLVQNAAVCNTEPRTGCTPDYVRETLLPLMRLDSQEIKVESVQRFDVVAEQVPAKVFFSNLIKGTKNNILLSPNITGEISLDLKKVTIKQVLESVRNLYGYEYQFTSAGIEISKPGLQTRAFKINYLNLERGGTSEMSVSSAGIGEGSTSGSSSSSTGSSSSSGSSGGYGGGEPRMHSRIKTTMNGGFWAELQRSLELMIGPGEGRHVSISPLAGLAVVQAYPNELRRVKDFLYSAERTLNRQVILEAKILEVELSDGYSSGVDWSLVSGGLRATQVGSGVLDSGANVPAIPGGIAYPLNPLGLSLDPGEGLNSLGTAGTQSGLFGGVMTLGMNFKRMAAFMELLQSQGKVQVLSSPRISTTNNQKALIKVGEDSFFITNIQASQVVTAGSVATANTLPDITFESFFTGIALDVTPQIDDHDNVTLHVHPIVSVVTETQTTVRIQDATTTYPLASSQVRESDTIVRARNGQVIVLGGLMQDKKNTLVTGIPCMKDLPIIGRWFRHERVKNVRSELIILIRPVVIDDEEWNTQLCEGISRVDRLQDPTPSARSILSCNSYCE